MSLPIRTTLDDINDVCCYFAKKATGASIKEARAVIDSKRVDSRKLSAMKTWGFIETSGDEKLKVTSRGRNYASANATDRAAILADVIREIPPYAAIVERVHHRNETSISATDVAAHWHEHFANAVATSDKILNDQAVCFFQIASGANLGSLVVGRKGSPTRFEFEPEFVGQFVDDQERSPTSSLEAKDVDDEIAHESTEEMKHVIGNSATEDLGQGIFIAHGKNKKPLEQLKRILGEFKVPYKVATEEPNVGRPISKKVRQTMEGCNCAILIFTADEEFLDKDGNTIWRPSENVVYELGASGYLYQNRIVIMKEDKVTFPSNFSDVGYISFEEDQLDAKTMDVLKELIAFGIVKVST